VLALLALAAAGLLGAFILARRPSLDRSILVE
jgi:hypothetical protein